MRYYFLDQDMNELRVELTKSQHGWSFNHDGQIYNMFIKKVAGKTYYSWDQKTWLKLTPIMPNENLVSHAQTFKVYRGFRPSGLNKGGAGSLVTQMPGKVVKIFKQAGDQVAKGETVMILEAMKMENEIKAGVEGKIKSVNIKEGQALEAGHLMMEIEEKA